MRRLFAEAARLLGRLRRAGRARSVTSRQRAEIDLRHTQERLRGLIDSVDGIVWELDVSTFCFTFVSEKAERLLGYPLDAWRRPRFWADILHPEDRDEAMRFCMERTQRMEPHDFEYRVLAQDGRVVWVREIVSVVVSEGRPVALQGIMLDVTAQKEVGIERERLLVAERAARAAAEEARAAAERAAEALRASEEKLRLAQGAAKMGSWDLDLRTGEIVCSERCNALFELAPGAPSTYERLLGAVHPEDRERIDRAMRDALSYRADFDVELRVLLQEGASRWIAMRGHGFYDQQAEAVRMAGMALDVSERKQAEAQLRLFGRVVETSSDFIGISTPDMKPIFVNEAGRRMVGLRSMEEVRRTVVLEYFSPEDRPRIESEAIPKLVREGRWSGEVRFRHFVTGASIPTMWNAFVIVDDAGAPVAWATVSPDLTAQKRAEQELREANVRLAEADRRKNEFLGVLSHELRNPLAALRNSIYVLNHVAAGGREATSARQIIQRQTEHLTRIVDDLLDVTRIARGRIDLRRTRVDLCEVVSRSCEDYRLLLGKAEVELRRELPTSPIWIDADPTRLAQVLGNLLHNAAKFTPAGGEVTVVVAASGGSAEVRVRDTGVGMRAEELRQLFEPFAQVEQGLARTHGGLGLGLALSKGLIDLHGGSLRARSDGPGRGSELSVLLPLASAPAASAAASPARRPGGGRLVLIIEDNADACESLSLALRLTGHEVRVAHDGKTGIAVAHDLKPEVVLCDIGLPGMNGYEVARRLRADEALCAMRLVAVTGYAQSEDKARAKEAGFDAHIAKPAKLNELTEILAK